jgi:glycosyltransferase involved in cell wall biosynthesis
VKIAMLTADYPPEVGGIASHIHELSRALVRQGHAVEVWHWTRQTSSEHYGARDGVRVRFFAPEVPPGPLKTLTSVGTLIRALSPFVGEFQPDVLHVHTLGPLPLVARRLRKRRPRLVVAFTNHSSGFLTVTRRLPGRLFARLAWGRTDLLLAPSRELLERSAILSAGRRTYIPNGVWAAEFAAKNTESARESLGLGSDDLVLMTTRRFAQKNGLRYLVEAMPAILRSVPHARLVMVGGPADDVEWDYVSTAIDELGLESSVTRLGAQPNGRVSSLLNDADIFCVPSLMEATSISALEAMANGRAIVATHVGGIPELIDHDVHGVLVPPGDTAALASAVIALALDERKREAVRQAAVARAAQEFDWSRIAAATAKEYRSVMRA